MGIGRRARRLAATATLVAAGCQSVPDRVAVPPTPGTAPAVPPMAAVASPPTLEPDYRTLPVIDPATAVLTPMTGPYRVVTEAECIARAAANAPLADVLDVENQRPDAPVWPGQPPESALAVELLAREVRSLAAQYLRLRSAEAAATAYFKLADVSGRTELLAASLPVTDKLQATVAEARAKGIRTPVEPDDLVRRRAELLGLLTQADLGAKLLDLEMKRRLDLPKGTAERVRPAGDFGPVTDAVDPEACVAVALERRPDLRLIRTIYLRLSPDTLPVAGQHLRTLPGLQGLFADGPPRKKPKPGACDPTLAAELAVRRQQLLAVIAERERQAADEVRAAAAAVIAQARQVALARWRAEQLTAKVTDAAKQGPLAELPAVLEAYRARADVVAAVMAWHEARVALSAAQGTLADPGRR